MKVCEIPAECPAPEYDWNADYKTHFDAEEKHKGELKTHLEGMGYTGPNTGRIYSTPMADGYALYMFADAPRGACLIHLPYGDGWRARDVEFLPKREILKRIAQQDKIAELFPGATFEPLT